VLIRERPLSSAEGRLNNFDGLRLAAALLVVIGHAFILTGYGPPPMALGTPIDTLGVYVFFSISGYLITGSWAAKPDLARFVRHRVLRIFPALIAVVLITVFAIGPALTTDSIPAYFRSGQTWDYLQGLVLLAQYNLPGVFTTAVHTRSAVNGSLWTLGVEFSCYIAVVLIGKMMRRHQALGFGVLSAVAITIVATSTLWSVPKGIFDAAQVVPFFAIGAIARLVIPERAVRPQFAIAALAACSLVTWLWPTGAIYVAWATIPFAVIAIGAASTPIFRRAARFGDLSYGTYLWAFPIQQAELDILGRIPIIFDVGVVVATVAVVSKLSWMLVEHPALRRKDPKKSKPQSPSLKRSRSESPRPTPNSVAKSVSS
jgi:peptidoglycan/LPS O-acetylase OafA/YrhL